MTKRIFKYTELIIFVTLISGFAAILFIFYAYFGTVQDKQLKTETAITAQAVEEGGLDYLRGLKLEDTRVTLIAGDGTVLYDNEEDASKMANHADRPEVKEALEKGEGKSTRYSDTKTTAMIYSALRLSDGSVLRVSEERNTVLTVALGMVLPMIWVFLILLIISWRISLKMSRQIVEPLNGFDLDHPLDNQDYPELAPFLQRINNQQKEIRQQKESLIRAEKDFVTVTDHMQECLILLSRKGKIISINNQAMKLLHADESCIGSDILYLERRVEFQRGLKKAADGEHTELILEYAGRHYQADISPIFSEDLKAAAGMVVLMFDVTDRENAEQMRREFTSNVSHELKTPLHTISGCAELLKSGGVRPEDSGKFVDLIFSQTQRMITLVDDLLQISHLDAGAADMKWEQLSLMDVVKSAENRLHGAAMTQNVQMTVSGSRPALIWGITRLVESIVFNLMDNALKYNRENGRVDVTVTEDDKAVRLSVKDNGVGIPAEDVPRIFERFYRVDKSHSREIGGTGLGLSIVKNAARILHADVDVKSELGKGTEFIIVFPKTKPTEA